MYLFFSLLFRYIVLTLWQQTLYSLLIHIEVVFTILPIFSCVIYFLSLCTCFLFIVCNLLFLFHTKMSWRVLFKVFQKYKLSKSFMPRTLFLQSFSRVCVEVDFIVFNKWIWVEWFMTSLIFYLFVLVLSRIAKRGDC